MQRSSWKWMVDACYDESHKDFVFYGACGVDVFEPWRESFERFLSDIVSDIGPRPEGMWLVRINKVEGFNPGNVEWASAKDTNNNRKSNHYITYKGRTQSASQWADEYGLPRQQITNRLNRGWTMSKTLTTPLDDRENFIEIDGVAKSVTEWSKESGRKRTTISNRLIAGMSPKDAVYGPLRVGRTDGICPRCNERPLNGNDSYCKECRAEYTARRRAARSPLSQELK